MTCERCNFRSKLLRQIHVLLKRFLLLASQLIALNAFDIKCNPMRVKGFRRPCRPSDTFCRGWRGPDADQHFRICHFFCGAALILIFVADSVCSLTHGNFTQEFEVLLREEVTHSSLSSFGLINLSVFKTPEQFIRLNINQFYFVGPVKDIVRHGFFHPNIGDILNHVIETFDMLDIYSRINIDSRI